jgi:hypothetical protein
VALSKERQAPPSREGEAPRRACDASASRTGAKAIAPCKVRRNIGTGVLQPHDMKTRHPACSEQYRQGQCTVSEK